MILHTDLKYLINSFVIAACCLQQCCVGQSTTVRPYKFGFNIEQQQHRFEQRDERGIVMGEFGFITADGIYHVTVYATDEHGRFRILAMKNYPYETSPKTVEVMVQPKMPPSTTTTPKPLKRHNFNTEACSGCFLANGNNKPKVKPNNIEGKTSQSGTKPLTKMLSTSSSVIEPHPSSKTTVTAPKIPAQGDSSPTLMPNYSANEPPSPPPIMDIIMDEILPVLMGKKSQSESSNPSASTTQDAVQPSKKPSSSRTDFVKNKQSFGSSGPSATNENGDLYRFKYILDYHGHSETGKRNGNKEGSYYVVGDDNVERTIEYVANEFGFQPRVRWRKLDSNEIKSTENSLKDYEFIWFKR